jgi:3-dehydroquinate synthase
MTYQEHTVQVALGDRTYPVLIGSGVRRAFTGLFKRLGSGRAFWITDRHVARLWGGDLLEHWKASPAKPIILPAGEEQKRLSVVERLCGKLIAAKVERGDTLVACGGGVIGDLVGFTAACYLRGIAFVQIPTTLLAMVDASVGGKTGVDLTQGKNLVGAFHQPRFVLADPDFLGTLPRREIFSGLAEVVKTALIGNRELFYTLESHSDTKSYFSKSWQPWDELVQACVRFKASVVARDERENDRRRILNFGHTIGHALEALGGFQKLRHGEAVFWGMSAALELSEEVGLLNSATASRIQKFMQPFLGAVPKFDFSPTLAMRLIAADKKVRGGRPQFVLLQDIAKPRLMGDISRIQLFGALSRLRRRMR